MYVGVGGVRPTIQDVLHDRAVKQRYVLRNNGDGGAQALLGYPRDILAAEHNAAALHIIETLQQHEQGRLAAARFADDTDALAGLHPQAEMREHAAPVE